MILAVRMYNPAKGSRLEQAPPDIDEVVKDHGACPSANQRHSGAGPGGNILRSLSSPAANVNDPKVNCVPGGNLMSNVQGVMIFLNGS
jgi:hypothetical protein